MRMDRNKTNELVFSSLSHIFDCKAICKMACALVRAPHKLIRYGEFNILY